MYFKNFMVRVPIGVILIILSRVYVSYIHKNNKIYERM